jgi:hypothetical protein
MTNRLKMHYEVREKKYDADSFDRVEPLAFLTGERQARTYVATHAENGHCGEWRHPRAEVGAEFGEFGEVLGESWWSGRDKRGRSEVTRGYHGGFTVSKFRKTFPFQFSLTGCIKASYSRLQNRLHLFCRHKVSTAPHWHVTASSSIRYARFPC